MLKWTKKRTKIINLYFGW